MPEPTRRSIEKEVQKMKLVSKIVSTFAVLAMPAAALAQADAFRNAHVGFTTVSGSAGDQLLLRTGYGTSPGTGALAPQETEQYAYQFGLGVGGRTELQTRARYSASDPNPPFSEARFNLFYPAPANYNPAGGSGPSPVAGWYTLSGFSTAPVTQRSTMNWTGGDSFINGPANNPTPLIGGDFAYEITSVVALNNSPIAKFALGRVDTPAGITTDDQRLLNPGNTIGSVFYDQFGLYDMNQPAGGSLADRSIFLGYGQHVEGWRMFISTQGLYEVTMRVYDTTGKYTSSVEYSYLVNSVPAPSSLALLALGATALRRRRTR